MNKLLALLLCLTLGLPLPLLAQTFPPLQVSGPEIPGNNYDDDGDGETDEIPATSIVQDANAAGNYHWHFKDCEKVTFANVADTTFPDSFRVEKPAGSTIIEGEVVCYIPNLPAATYTLHIQYSTPGGTRAIWPGVNKSLRYQMKPEQASILPFITTPQWQYLVYTGTAAAYYAGQNAGDGVSFVWPGGSFAIAFKSDDVRLACGYLAIGAEPVRTCPGQTGTPLLADYEMLELGGETIPTAWNSAAFTHANTMNLTGAAIGTICAAGEVTIKGLWDNTTTDRHYWSINCADTDDETVTIVNDSTSMPGADQDQVDIRWRGDLKAVFDTDTYMVIGNLQPVYFDADWSGTANARNPAVNLNTTVVRNIVSTTSWNMFIATDLGSNIAPDTFGLFNLAVQDKDALVSGAFKYFHGNSLTDIAQWGVIKWSATAVKASGGGGDVTAPVVTSPAIPAGTVEQSSFIMTANTNEDGTCVMRMGAVKSGQYELTPTAGTPSVNGVCTVAKTGLASGTTFYAVIDVIDAAKNTGTSSEVSTKTAGSGAVATCTKYAAPVAAGAANGSTASDPYLINGFWTSGHAVPGAVLCLASGTYKGTPSMITPTAGINGTALAPITIKASTDGGPWIHGESKNRPVFLNNNDYWILEGFDASDSAIQVPGQAGVVVIGGGSTNSIIRRVCAWDAPGTLSTHNERVFGLTNDLANNNLLEDVCAFGTGRKMFSITQGGNNTIIRRAWGVFEKDLGAQGPEEAFTIAYNTETNTLENVIGTWKQGVAADSNNAHGLVQFANEGANHKILGSLFYVRSGDLVAPSRIIRTDWQAVPHGPVEIRDVIINTEQSSKMPFSLANGSGVCTNCTITNTTEVGGAASSIGGVWTQTNRDSFASIAAMNTAGANPFQTTTGNGGRMCFRYGNPADPFTRGVLTTTKLWPWPMDSRINAALVRAGKTPSNYFRGTGNTVTSEVETQFGTIPSGCKD